MEEEIFNDSFPDLRELENKVGRKTPESLLIWMRDAEDCEDGRRSDVVDRGERSSASSASFSDKINNLRQEMRWLRSADVRILRQLVAVHEGIEAMRWLMEERDTLVSRCSSLTGSLSSLVTVEEHGPSMSPCRESPSSTQDFPETTCEESEDQIQHIGHGDSNHKSYFSMLSHESIEARSPGFSSSTIDVSGSSHSRHDQASSSPVKGLVGANLPKSQLQDSDVAPLKNIKTEAKTIRRALHRSQSARREVKVANSIFPFTKPTEKMQTEPQTQSFRASQNNKTDTEENAPSSESILQGYDAKWCWVESQDDVTFL